MRHDELIFKYSLSDIIIIIIIINNNNNNNAFVERQCRSSRGAGGTGG